MTFSKFHVATLGMVLALGGCSFADEALFPSLSEPSPKIKVEAGAGAQDSYVIDEPPSLGTGSFEPPRVSQASSTGTFVGQKVEALRGDLAALQASLSSHNAALQEVRAKAAEDARRYHATVAAINTKLQVGTTPGNPIMAQQWNVAQSELDQISQDIVQMNRLSGDVAANSAMAVYLLDGIRAARSLSGAVDEDHRQLRVLEDETNYTVVTIDRLLTELTADITRQQQYVMNEKGNLNVLSVAVKNGQLYGTSLAGALGPSSTAAPSAAAAPAVSDRPLVVIRFDKANVDYETSLYNAVKSALERRPSSVFEVVAVSPLTGAAPGQASLQATSARRNAEAVVRSLANMGLPPARIRSSTSTSNSAKSAEVHVLVR